HCVDFFAWYNTEHHHTGIALHTPYEVHHGLAALRATERQNALLAAFQAHPERFPNGAPKPPQLDAAVWINKPKTVAAARMSAPVASAHPSVPPCAPASETAVNRQ